MPQPRRDPDERLPHPDSAMPVFGHFPELGVKNGPLFPSGEIVLAYGHHLGPNRGFGFQHIWVEHFRRMEEHDAALERISRFVAGILRPRTPIYYELGSRAAIFRGSAGQVIVELRDGPNPFYSVVTAFVAHRVHGDRVGALLAPEKPKAPAEGLSDETLET